MSEAFSVESILFKDTFNSNTNTLIGDKIVNTSDNIVKDLAQAEEDLKFFDTYELINSKNTSDKMKMLKRINNVYAKNVYNKSAKNSIESYVISNIRSTEDDAAGTGNATGTKKNFFKNAIELMKKFIMSIVNFIKTLFNKVLTFFKTIKMNPQQLQLVKDNPYKGDKNKNYLNYSSFNLSGIDKFCKIYKSLKTQINSTSTGDTRNVQQNASDLNKGFSTFMSKMQSKLKFDPSFESVAWNLFGMKACDGDECYKFAKVKTLAYLSGIGTKSPIEDKLKDIQSLLDEINKNFEPLQKFSENIDDAKGAAAMNNRARTTAARMNELQNNKGQQVNNTGLSDNPTEAAFKGSVKITADGENFEVTTKEDFKNALNFFKGLIKTTNFATQIMAKFGKDAKALIDLNSGKKPKEENNESETNNESEAENK